VGLFQLAFFQLLLALDAVAPAGCANVRTRRCRIADRHGAGHCRFARQALHKEFLFSQSNNGPPVVGDGRNGTQRIREVLLACCVNCGNEINAKRLEAVPWTRYCIECQEKLEKSQLEEAHE